MISCHIETNDFEIKHIHKLTDYSFNSRIDNHKIKFTGDFDNLNYGDVITPLAIDCSNPTNSYNNQVSFDYSKYLLSQNIITTCSIDDYVTTSHHIAPIRNLRLYFLDYFQNYPLICSLIFGLKDQTTSNVIGDVGLSHLFVISGTHVAIILIFIKNFISIFITDFKKQQLTITISLIVFSLLCGFNVPVLRVVIVYILTIVFPDKPILKISMLLFLVINPQLSHNSSFILSYLVSFYIKTYPSQSNTLIGYIKDCYNIYLLTLPIQVHFNHSINILTPFLNALFIPIFTIFVIPYCVVCIIFPVPILLQATNVLYYSMIFLFKCLTVFNINIADLNLVMDFIYYFSYYYMITNNSIYFKVVCLLLTVTCIFNHQNYIIDIPDVNAPVVILKTPEFNALINTTENSADTKELINVIKGLGINQIDYLISDNKQIIKNSYDTVKIKNILSYDEIKNEQNQLGKFEITYTNDSIILRCPSFTINVSPESILLTYRNNQTIEFCSTCENNNTIPHYLRKKGEISLKF